MTPEEFATFCQSLANADGERDSVNAQNFFRAVSVGIKVRNPHVPADNEVVVEGYKVGKEIRKRLK